MVDEDAMTTDGLSLETDAADDWGCWNIQESSRRVTPECICNAALVYKE
jgi:hypothetical protein